MESNSFTYHALDSHTDEIRLISLEACDLAEADAQLACSLITAKLSENPNYEALSYMWGSQSTSAIITVDGQDLVVGENLWLALKQLRLGASRRTIWIDAICINQADTTERNHQVSQMSKIYSCAEQVLVWLGPGTGFSDQAMRFLADVADGTIPTPECTWYFFEDHWKAVEKFFQSEYGKRLWIIQEVVLARKVLVMWGAAVLPFTAFQIVCEKMESAKGLRYWNLDVIRQLSKSLPAKLLFYRGESRILDGTGTTLVDLMATFFNAACKDEKDKIFGLLSLSDSCCQDSMSVEYSRPAFELYNKAFSHHLECHLDVKSSDEYKASILFLRYRLHEASKEHPRRPSDLVSTIIFTVPLEYLSRLSNGDDLPHPLGDSSTTWNPSYHYIYLLQGSVAFHRATIIDDFRRYIEVPPPPHPDSGWYLKTTQVKFFLADNGMVGFVPPNLMVGDQLLRSSDGKSLKIRRLDSSGSWNVIATAQQYKLRLNREIELTYMEFKL